MDKKITLSISIPIYKRPDLLAKSLTSIGECFNNGSFNFEIELLIVDDSCSTINQETIDGFMDTYPQINVRYIKNDVNVGIDKNIANALFLSNSDYVWLMGEDDIISRDSFHKIEPMLFKDLDFIALNYATVNNQYSTLRESNFPRLDSLPSDGIVDIDFFLNHYFVYVGFIGSCIFKRADLNKSHYMGYIGSYFSHLSPFLTDKNWRIGIVNEVLVFNRAEDFSSFSWKNDAFEVMFGMVHLTSHPNTKIGSSRTEPLKLILLNFQEVFSVKRLLSLRAEGIFNANKLKLYYAPLFSAFPLKTIIAYLIGYLPLYPLKGIKKLYKRLK